MPSSISSFKKSDAYVSYTSFPRRPEAFPIWPRNEDGHHVVENGELFCQCEVKCAICKDDRRFETIAHLTVHIKKRHDPTMIERIGRPNGNAEHQLLIDFYANLVKLAKGSPSDAASFPTAPPEIPPALPRAPLSTPQFTQKSANNREILSEDDDADQDQEEDEEQDYDDEDDGGPAGGPGGARGAAATPDVPGQAPIVEHTWRRATDQPTSNSLCLMIHRDQERGREMRRKWLEDNNIQM